MFNRKPEIYRDISELPAFNWFEVYRTNDLSFVLKKPVKDAQKYLTVLEAAWSDIVDSYIKRFGIADTFRQIVELKVKIARLEMQLLYKEDASLRTMVKIHLAELQQLTQERPKQTLKDISKQRISIERAIGRKIDLKKITTLEYFEYIEFLTEENLDNGRK